MSRKSVTKLFFAVVEFTDGKVRRVVESTDLKDFMPRHATDYDSEGTYQALWANGTNSFDGFYDCKILLLAG